MSFRAVVEELKTPKIYALVYKNGTNIEIKGFRIRICKATRGRGAVPMVQYYDFASKLIKDAALQRFVVDNATRFEKKYLIPYSEEGQEEVFITQEEIDGVVEPQEFRSSEDAEKVISIAKAYFEKELKA